MQRFTRGHDCGHQVDPTGAAVMDETPRGEGGRLEEPVEPDTTGPSEVNSLAAVPSPNDALVARAPEEASAATRRDVPVLNLGAHSSYGPTPTFAASASPAPVRTKAPSLPGEFAPLERRGPAALLAAVLRTPANVAHEVRHRPKVILQLVGIVVVSMLITGFVVGSFSGGGQFLAVPVKLAGGLVFAAAICFPSLYILSALSGAKHNYRDVAGALFLGLSVTSVLLVGFAPIAWVFSQSTSSPGFMGFIYLGFYLLSAAFGLSVMVRALRLSGERPFPAAVLWSLVFLVVTFQLTTTLRPLLGDYDGVALL
ncbi:MAG: hypothetical protein AAGF12_38935, partial [Myxococcota bacterium]